MALNHGKEVDPDRNLLRKLFIGLQTIVSRQTDLNKSAGSNYGW